MALLQAVSALNKRLGTTRRLLSDIDNLAGSLEQRTPLSGAAIGSSVGPGLGGIPEGGTGPGMPDLTGRSIRIGGAGGESADGGGATGGIINPETNRDKIGAIIDAAGIVPPEEDDWDPTGLGPGLSQNFILTTVLAAGAKAGRSFLVWCAGWLAYSSVAELSSMSTGGVGNRAGTDSPFRQWFWERVANQAGPMRLPPVGRGASRATGGTTGTGSGGGGDTGSGLPPLGGGNGSPLGPGGYAPGQTAPGGGSWMGSSAEGMSPAQARDIEKSTRKTADATTELVGAVRDLTAVVKRGQDSVGGRAGGFA